jgi:hypothetical protein
MVSLSEPPPSSGGLTRCRTVAGQEDRITHAGGRAEGKGAHKYPRHSTLLSLWGHSLDSCLYSSLLVSHITSIISTTPVCLLHHTSSGIALHPPRLCRQQYNAPLPARALVIKRPPVSAPLRITHSSQLQTSDLAQISHNGTSYPIRVPLLLASPLPSSRLCLAPCPHHGPREQRRRTQPP